jgi:hypothetical protein
MGISNNPNFSFDITLRLVFTETAFCRDTALLTKNYSLHITYMRRRNFSFAPCLA